MLFTEGKSLLRDEARALSISPEVTAEARAFASKMQQPSLFVVAIIRVWLDRFDECQCGRVVTPFDHHFR
jgi:hypothetical protein